MDINFEAFRRDLDKFEKVWKKARKEDNTPKMASILNAFANDLDRSHTGIRKMADLMSETAVNTIMDEIKKA